MVDNCPWSLAHLASGSEKLLAPKENLLALGGIFFFEPCRNSAHCFVHVVYNHQPCCCTVRFVYVSSSKVRAPSGSLGKKTDCSTRSRHASTIQKTVAYETETSREWYPATTSCRFWLVQFSINENCLSPVELFQSAWFISSDQ